MGRNTVVTLLSLSALVPLLLSAAAPVTAEQVTRADRESSYPPEVENVTQDPWRPRAGEDVTVRMTLHEDADVPSTAHLVYCRVEPEYVCGAPSAMASDDGGRVWTGVVAYDGRFMKDDTVHVGYSVTMRYLDPSGHVERVTAPTGNYWVPPTFPAETGDNGTYFFFAYDRSGSAGALAPSPAPFLWVLPLLALAYAARSGRRGGARGR